MLHFNIAYAIAKNHVEMSIKFCYASMPKSSENLFSFPIAKKYLRMSVKFCFYIQHNIVQYAARVFQTKMFRAS
jgi:hypothetical protein